MALAFVYVAAPSLMTLLYSLCELSNVLNLYSARDSLIQCCSRRLQRLSAYGIYILSLRALLRLSPRDAAQELKNKEKKSLEGEVLLPKVPNYGASYLLNFSDA